ncbi:MAG: hypothetical protein ACUZ77_08055 [Candidatus Brocadiales bacterium]
MKHKSLRISCLLVAVYCILFPIAQSSHAQWAATYGGSGDDVSFSSMQTTDGGYIVSGETNSFGAGDDDFWVLKLDSNGNVQWQKTYGGSNKDEPFSIQQTSDGGYVVAGGTHSYGAGGEDSWVLKLDSSGNIQWQKTYGGGVDDDADSSRQTSDGGYILTGGTNSFGTGNEDIWVLKLDSSGNVQWQKTYGGNFLDYADGSIQQTSDGGYVVAGETASFGTGGEDLWVLKLKPDGSIDSSCDFIQDTSVSGIDSNATVTDTSASVADTTVTPQDTSATVQDTSVSANIICKAVVVEDCTNGIDDDGDGDIDCDDSDCTADPACVCDDTNYFKRSVLKFNKDRANLQLCGTSDLCSALPGDVVLEFSDCASRTISVSERKSGVFRGSEDGNRIKINCNTDKVKVRLRNIDPSCVTANVDVEARVSAGSECISAKGTFTVKSAKKWVYKGGKSCP